MVCFDTIYNGTRTKTIDTINTKAKEDFKKERLKVDIRMRNHSIFRLDTHRNPAYLCAITNY
ncbi:hypothetical protein [Bacteroides acidifaciens]|uniref:hypothetical protein n=1 Tax=Bacteroides acidifaciens TaxID=85831 RepID=UPI003014E875